MKKTNPAAVLGFGLGSLCLAALLAVFLGWHVLNQEGRPWQTGQALLALSLRGRPYYQISDSPEIFVYRDRAALLAARGLALSDQLGAMLILHEHGEARCGELRQLTRWYTVLELRAC